jgi:hypothetical protein
MRAQIGWLGFFTVLALTSCAQRGMDSGRIPQRDNTGQLVSDCIGIVVDGVCHAYNKPWREKCYRGN